jgi:HPt (histidine-containing phosphotransfer) domain-containing protein
MKECCRTYLDEQFAGDADGMAEIYGEYVSSTRAKVTEAGNALASGDWTQLDRIAHTVKGNALAAGDTETGEVAIALRKAAALKDTAESAALIAKMDRLSKEL